MTPEQRKQLEFIYEDLCTDGEGIRNIVTRLGLCRLVPSALPDLQEALDGIRVALNEISAALGDA